MEQLRNHDDAWPFIDRVEEEKAPEYYKIVKQPMYITKMEDRVSNGYYVTFELFDEDFKLMMYNCRLYNSAGTQVTTRIATRNWPRSLTT